MLIHAGPTCAAAARLPVQPLLPRAPQRRHRHVLSCRLLHGNRLGCHSLIGHVPTQLEGAFNPRLHAGGLLFLPLPLFPAPHQLSPTAPSPRRTGHTQGSGGSSLPRGILPWWCWPHLGGWKTVIRSHGGGVCVRQGAGDRWWAARGVPHCQRSRGTALWCGLQPGALDARHLPHLV